MVFSNNSVLVKANEIGDLGAIHDIYPSELSIMEKTKSPKNDAVNIAFLVALKC